MHKQLFILIGLWFTPIKFSREVCCFFNEKGLKQTENSSDSELCWFNCDACGKKK